MILSTVKKISYFFTSDIIRFIFFTVANRGCFDNLRLTFSREDLEIAPSIIPIKRVEPSKINEK